MSVKLRVGGLYVVRGEGVLRLVGVGQGACEFESHGRYHCWFSRSEVIRPADWRDVDAYQKQARPRCVACEDPRCWCRRRTA